MRLNMIIVDTDKNYLDALEANLVENYNHKLHLSLFSRREYLIETLKDNKIDILLINFELFTHDLMDYSIKQIILLSDGKQDTNDTETIGVDLPIINKYQACDKLIGQIMDLLSLDQVSKSTIEGESKTKIISCYSPLGGSGKTTVAITLSTLLSQSGKEVLFLSFEEFSTLALFFKYDEKKITTSDLFYLVKDNNRNLANKLKAMELKDHATQIHFIGPLESPLEWEEITENDIAYLLSELHNSGLYDYIIIDLSIPFDWKNIATMQASQQILLVLKAGNISTVKSESFFGEINKHSELKDNLLEKALIVMNGSSIDLETKLIAGKTIDIFLPQEDDLWHIRNNQLLLNTSSNFASIIYQLMEESIMH